jgi:hypothetical protein
MGVKSLTFALAFIKGAFGIIVMPWLINARFVDALSVTLKIAKRSQKITSILKPFQDMIMYSCFYVGYSLHMLMPLMHI